MIRGLPEGWKSVKLIDAVGGKSSLIVGGPFGSDLKVSDYVDSGVPIIRLQNVGWGTFIEKNLKRITTPKAKELAYHSFLAGDVILAKLGDPIGKSCMVPESVPSGIVVSDVVRIRNQNPSLETRYLMHFLNSPSVIRQLNKRVFGTTRPRVNLSEVRNLVVTMPPRETQRRIVAILERAESARQARSQAIEQGQMLLRSVFLEMFGDPVKNPKRWPTEELEHLCERILGGGTPSMANEKYYEGTIPWVTPKDMKQDFIVDSIDHISARATEESSTRRIHPNSLLMVVRSGILKKELPTAINLVEVTINQDMKAFVLDEKKINTLFLLWFFKIYQRYLLGKVRSFTADNLEFDMVKRIEIILPPMSLQEHFASFARRLYDMATIESKHLGRINDLVLDFESRAFKGELVA
jgi:type I restriction enzyme S subunit